MELDRYLFNESGDPLSRPTTPTVTKVNYKEGIKPDLSRVPTPIRSTVAIGNSTDSCRQSITSPSPQLLESIGRTPESTPDRSRPPSRSSTASSPLVKSLPGDGFGSSRGTPLSISLNSSLESSREDNTTGRPWILYITSSHTFCYKGGLQWSNLTKCGLFFNIVSPAVHTFFLSVLQRLDSCSVEALILNLENVIFIHWSDTTSQPIVFPCWGTENMQMVPNQENIEGDQPV